MTVADVPPFIDRTNHRSLAAHTGDIFVWDIDKTYLDTRFSSLRGLLSIPLEFAVDKRAVPGAVPLLRAIRRGPGPKSALTPLYFVSGSPRQLRPVIEQKMTLDGVDFDGITFKDHLALLRSIRTSGLLAQVGYKLLALLLYRLEAHPAATWWLVGDDVEADEAVFLLFREVCGGLKGKSLDKALQERGVNSDQRRRCISLADCLSGDMSPFGGIFIHLASGHAPLASTTLGVYQTLSYVQVALVLASAGRIQERDLRAVTADLRRHHMTEAMIEKHLEDAVIRLGVPETFCPYVRLP
ncbi:MAG: hypothetical protein ACO3JL_04530 [Myxococcota bacterium]